MSELLEIIQELTSLRLSSHQVSLLLSSIWVQASWIENTPANFQALAHTYSIALLFSRSKVGYSSNSYVLGVFHFSCAALIVILILGESSFFFFLFFLFLFFSCFPRVTEQPKVQGQDSIGSFWSCMSANYLSCVNISRICQSNSVGYVEQVYIQFILACYYYISKTLQVMFLISFLLVYKVNFLVQVCIK